MDLTTLSIPVLPGDDAARQQEQLRRDRYWEGAWRELLEQDVIADLNTQRREIMGVLDYSFCLGPQICRELAVCYLSAPQVTRNGSTPRLCESGGPVERSLLWSFMPDFQGRVIWLQEYILRVDLTSTGGLIYRQVPPWLVTCEPDPAHPDQPIRYTEWVQRTIGGVPTWTRDIIDCTDPEDPVYRIEMEQGGRTLDVTEEVLGSPQSGPDYPFRYGDGTPFVPAELYHRDPSTALWNYTRGSELFQATRLFAIDNTFFRHLWKNACWRQRVILGGTPRGASIQGAAGVHYITPDPTLVLQIDASETGINPQIGSWEPGAEMSEAVTYMQARMAQAAHAEGVSPAELQRLSGDATSGYAMSLTNAGKRAAQRRFGPQFRARDESLLCKSAAILNRDAEAMPNRDGASPPYPEDGYRVAYTSIPLSPDEEEAIRAEVDWEIAHGYISPAQGLQRLRPELSLKDAQAIIDRNKATTPAAPTTDPDPKEPAHDAD